jgi:hypothetical protein
MSERGDKEAVVDTPGKEAVVDTPGKEAVVDTPGKGAVVDTPGKGAAVEEDLSVRMESVKVDSYPHSCYSQMG